MNKKKERYLKSKTFKIQNETLKLKAKVLNTSREKTHGLMGTDKIFPVYFETRFGIHTFGMKKPIDVLILDHNFQVVKIKHGLKPGNVLFWNPKYSRVVEMPVNYIKVKISDQICLC